MRINPQKVFLSSKRSYSKFAGWISFGFSNIALASLYINGSFLWLYLSMLILLTFVSLVFGNSLLYEQISLKSYPLIIRRIVIVVLYTSFFISSLYGFIVLINLLPIIDKSTFLIPGIAIAFIFGGASIVIFQRHTSK